MFDELISNLVDEDMCLIDVVIGDKCRITKELEDYDIKVDDDNIYITKDDERCVIGHSQNRIEKENCFDFAAYRIDIAKDTEVFISFPLSESA